MQIRNVVIDCADLDRLAHFWEAATGYARTWGNEYFVVLSPSELGQPNLLLQRVPEPKVGKTRCHIDLQAEAETEAELARLVELGATRGESFDFGVKWTVMTDPEGTGFCVTHREAAASG